MAEIRDLMAGPEPTWRQRLADQVQAGLEKMGVPRYQARRRAQTVLGGASSNLPAGMGLADVTPLGLAFGAQEGGLAAGEGVGRAERGDVLGGLAYEFLDKMGPSLTFID